MLVLANLYWGLSFPLIKMISSLSGVFLPGAGSWFVTAMAVAPRYAIATALLLLLGLRRGARPTADEVRQGLGIGVFAAAGTLLQTDALPLTAASTSAFLTQFSAILIPAGLALRRRRNPGALVWACCALVIIGVGVLGHFDVRTLRLGRGEWETLLCSVFFTGQIVWVGRRRYAGNRPGQVTLVMFAVQGAAFAALTAATAPSPGALLVPWESPRWVALTLALTLICTIGAFSIMTRWQPRITATEAGLIYCVEPIFASVFALFLPAMLSSGTAVSYPNERATASLLVGGGLITLANVLIQVAVAPGRAEGAS